MRDRAPLEFLDPRAAAASRLERLFGLPVELRIEGVGVTTLSHDERDEVRALLLPLGPAQASGPTIADLVGASDHLAVGTTGAISPAPGGGFAPARPDAWAAWLEARGAVTSCVGSCSVENAGRRGAWERARPTEESDAGRLLAWHGAADGPRAALPPCIEESARAFGRLGLPALIEGARGAGSDAAWRGLAREIAVHRRSRRQRVELHAALTGAELARLAALARTDGDEALELDGLAHPRPPAGTQLIAACESTELRELRVDPPLLALVDGSDLRFFSWDGRSVTSLSSQRVVHEPVVGFARGRLLLDRGNGTLVEPRTGERIAAPPPSLWERVRAIGRRRTAERLRIATRPAARLLADSSPCGLELANPVDAGPTDAELAAFERWGHLGIPPPVVPDEARWSARPAADGKVWEVLREVQGTPPEVVARPDARVVAILRRSGRPEIVCASRSELVWGPLSGVPRATVELAGVEVRGAMAFGDDALVVILRDAAGDFVVGLSPLESTAIES